jgi:hypothetical protein
MIPAVARLRGSEITVVFWQLLISRSIISTAYSGRKAGRNGKACHYSFPVISPPRPKLLPALLAPISIRFYHTSKGRHGAVKSFSEKLPGLPETGMRGVQGARVAAKRARRACATWKGSAFGAPAREGPFSNPKPNPTNRFGDFPGSRCAPVRMITPLNTYSKVNPSSVAGASAAVSVL